MIILICPKAEEADTEGVAKHISDGKVVHCVSVEEAIVLFTEKRCIDPIVTFAPTADVLDKIISNFKAMDDRALIVIYDTTEEQAVSIQSYLIEAYRKLIGPAKDGVN